MKSGWEIEVEVYGYGGRWHSLAVDAIGNNNTDVFFCSYRFPWIRENMLQVKYA